MLMNWNMSFFVSGHSFNKGDTMHSCTERASRNISIYTTSQWAQVIRSAKRSMPRFIVKEMDCHDFMDIKAIADMLRNFELSTDREKIAWLQIKRMRLLKAQRNVVRIYYDYSEDFKTLNLAQKIRVKHDLPDANEIQLQPATLTSIPVSVKKHKDLMDLCNKDIIPRVYHSYYENISHE